MARPPLKTRFGQYDCMFHPRDNFCVLFAPGNRPIRHRRTNNVEITRCRGSHSGKSLVRYQDQLIFRGISVFSGSDRGRIALTTRSPDHLIADVTQQLVGSLLYMCCQQCVINLVERFAIVALLGC